MRILKFARRKLPRRAGDKSTAAHQSSPELESDKRLVELLTDPTTPDETRLEEIARLLGPSK